MIISCINQLGNQIEDRFNRCSTQSAKVLSFCLLQEAMIIFGIASLDLFECGCDQDHAIFRPISDPHSFGIGIISDNAVGV